MNTYVVTLETESESKLKFANNSTIISSKLLYYYDNGINNTTDTSRSYIDFQIKLYCSSYTCKKRAVFRQRIWFIPWCILCCEVSPCTRMQLQDFVEHIDTMHAKLNHHWQYDVLLLCMYLYNMDRSRKSIFHEAGMLGGFLRGGNSQFSITPLHRSIKYIVNRVTTINVLWVSSSS